MPKPADLAAAVTTALGRRVRPGAPRCAVILARSSGRRLRAVSRLIDEGRVRVPVEAVLGLDRAAEALDRSRTFHTRGKLVLRIP